MTRRFGERGSSGHFSPSRGSFVDRCDLKQRRSRVFVSERGVKVLSSPPPMMVMAMMMTRKAEVPARRGS